MTERERETRRELALDDPFDSAALLYCISKEGKGN